MKKVHPTPELPYHIRQVQQYFHVLVYQKVDREKKCIADNGNSDESTTHCFRNAFPTTE